MPARISELRSFVKALMPANWTALVSHRASDDRIDICLTAPEEDRSKLEEVRDAVEKRIRARWAVVGDLHFLLRFRIDEGSTTATVPYHDPGWDDGTPSRAERRAYVGLDPETPKRKPGPARIEHTKDMTNNQFAKLMKQKRKTR